jgi:C-terminal processing protease CtpA/Prc
VLTIDTFGGDPGDFEDFLEQVFQGLHDQPPRALVVDLRRNGGGDSRLGDELLQYVAHEPWRQSSRKEWKMSDRYRDFLKSYLRAWIRWLPVQYLHPTGWRMWSAEDGEIVVIDEDLEQPRDEPLRFDGPVAFLVGPGTFSAAKSLAAAVKDYQLALLVGEETGGQLNGFGEAYPFRLPRTQLAGQVASARFVRPNGDASTRGGVQPDVVVRPAPDAKYDVVLEAAIATLLPPGAP